LSRIRLYLDEDAAQRGLLAALRAAGEDVTSAQEQRLDGRKDEEQLSWCRDNRRTLYTFNVRDFYALHSRLLMEGGVHSGIILAPQQRYSIGQQLRRLMRLLANKSDEEMQCRIEYLSAWRDL
jgi:hypothetical protein